MNHRAPLSGNDDNGANLLLLRGQVHLKQVGRYLQQKREGVEIARCTVERLIKQLGLADTHRRKVAKTSAYNKAIACRLDAL